MALTNVPLAGQTLAQTRDPIANNFSTINNAFLVDHVEYNISGQGKHNQVTFPPHTGSVPHVAGEIILFNQNTSLTGVPDIWMQRGSVALSTSNPIPITGSMQATNGWTYLPSGIFIKWGTSSVTRNTLSTITFPTGSNIPAFALNGVFSMQASQTFGAGPSTGDLNTAVSVGNVTNLNFQLFARAIGLPSGSSVNIFWMAIGIGA